MRLVRSLLSVSCFAAFAGILAGGCNQGGAPSDSDDEDVAAFASPVMYLGVAAPTGSADDAGFQSVYGGSTLVIDDSDPEDPALLCWHDDAGVEEKLVEYDQPNEITCASPGADTGSDPEATASGPAGTSTVPHMDKTWSGSQNGGCGTWATAVCNRILGDTPAGSPVSNDEWNKIAIGIKQDPNTGGSYATDVAAYYREKGYCVETKDFGGSSDDYDAMSDKLNKDNCDVKLSFHRRLANGTYTNGHVETVTGVTHTGAVTNSWGNDGYVQGGSDGGFSHSLDGKNFKDKNGNRLWPPNATQVTVQYVCKCGTFESLVAAL